MCMLTKRTNILFDEELWKKLLAIACSSNKSVGQIVREAVCEKYYDRKQEERSRAYHDILRIRKKFKHVDYEELINAGRER